MRQKSVTNTFYQTAAPFLGGALFCAYLPTV